jgi:caspase domain-containing protein
VDGARSALVVASDGYTDPGLGRLRAPASDARALERVLRDPEIGGFEVRTLLNEPAHEVNLAVEEFFADRRPDDLLLVHFSCHGVKDESGELYFAMANTLLRRLGATAVAAEFVNRRMSRSRSRRVVLLLDCCYAGAFERGMTARAGEGMGIEAQFGGRGRAVITASSAMEYAFEGDELADTRELAPSVFTSALVEGLETGDADRDQDGLVALDELYDYIYDKVRTVTPNQTPGKWTFGVQGELVIARRARPVTTPASLPPELQEAIDSPLAAVRGAAVQELARLLHGKHAGRALAAQLALERLTDDDSRTVAAAATEALGAQTPPRPPAREPEETATAVGARRAGRVDGTVTAKPDGAVSAGDGDSAPPDSDGAAATTGVQGRAVSTPPASPSAVTSRAEAAPTAAQRTQPEPRQDAVLPQGSAAPVPSGASDDAATASPLHAAQDRLGVAQARFDRRLLTAGGLAVVGAVLTIVALFPTFTGQFRLISFPANTSENIIMAFVALGAGVCLFVPRTRRLIGPGLLLGGVATAPTWVMYDLIVSHFYPPAAAGMWLHLLGMAVWLLACWLVLLSLAQARDVRLVLRLPQGVIAWLVALLGVVGTVALFLQVEGAQAIPGRDGQAFVPSQDLAPLIWAAAVALVIPAAAVAALPRQFGVALLAGWICDGASMVAFYTGFPGGVFGFTLLALVALIVPFALIARPSGVKPTAGG